MNIYFLISHNFYIYNKISGDNTNTSILKENKIDIKKEEVLVCISCGNIITILKNKIEVNNSHTHSFINPSNIKFNIGCFKEAKGCIIAGDLTDDFTWFNGFSWCFCICSNCNTHIGWYYESNEKNSFYGLILDKLVSSKF